MIAVDEPEDDVFPRIALFVLCQYVAGESYAGSLQVVPAEAGELSMQSVKDVSDKVACRRQRIRRPGCERRPKRSARDCSKDRYEEE